MPNRIIKESICTSDSIWKLDWFEECFFYRLIVNCDDFGRFDARYQVLKSKLFPLIEDKKLPMQKIKKALEKLSVVGCVTLYESDGKPFLQINSWEKHQTIRNKKSKYPSFNDKNSIEINCKQLQADDFNCPRNPIQSKSNPNPNPESILQPGAGNVPPSEPIASLMLNDKTYHHIYQENVDHYRELYPAVNIEQELRNMIGWLESNPTKRKTKSGIDRFINGWLSKNQNRGGTNTYEPERPNNGEFIPSESGALSIEDFERITDPDSE